MTKSIAKRISNRRIVTNNREERSITEGNINKDTGLVEMLDIFDHNSQTSNAITARKRDILNINALIHEENSATI